MHPIVGIVPIGIGIAGIAVVGISISRPLLLMVHKSLGGGVKSLGDRVKTGAGSEWHSMVSITIKSGIGISSIAVVAIGGVAMVAIGIGVAIGIVGIGIGIC